MLYFSVYERLTMAPNYHTSLFLVYAGDSGGAHFDVNFDASFGLVIECRYCELHYRTSHVRKFRNDLVVKLSLFGPSQENVIKFDISMKDVITSFARLGVIWFRAVNVVTHNLGNEWKTGQL